MPLLTSDPNLDVLWERACQTPDAGLRELLSGLASTPTGDRLLEILCGRARIGRFESRDLQSLDVEHPEHLESPPTHVEECLVFDIETQRGLVQLSITRPVRGEVPPDFPMLWERVGSLRFGSCTLVGVHSASIWDVDEYKFDDVMDESLVDRLLETWTVVENGEHQWVVKTSGSAEMYLVTGLLHRDFSDKGGYRADRAALEADSIDPSLGAGEIFLRFASLAFFDGLHTKSVLHPMLAFEHDRPRVPVDAEAWPPREQQESPSLLLPE